MRKIKRVGLQVTRENCCKSKTRSQMNQPHEVKVEPCWIFSDTEIHASNLLYEALYKAFCNMIAIYSKAKKLAYLIRKRSLTEPSSAV